MKGQVVHTETPLLLQLSLDRHKQCLSCASCMQPLGTWQNQADLLLGRSYSDCVERLLRNETLYRCCNTNSCNTQPAACSSYYCSIKCRDGDKNRGHGILCINANRNIDSSELLELDQDRADKMTEFHNHANDTNEIFLAAAAVIAQLIIFREKMKSNSISIDGKLAKVDSTDRLIVEWLQNAFPLPPDITSVITNDEANKLFQLYKETFENDIHIDRNSNDKNEVEESWMLLYPALLSVHSIELSSSDYLLSLECYRIVVEVLTGYLHTSIMGKSLLIQHYSEYLQYRNSTNTRCEEEVYINTFLRHHYDNNNRNNRDKEYEEGLAQIQSDSLLLYSALTEKTLPAKLSKYNNDTDSDNSGGRFLFSVPGSNGSVAASGAIVMVLLPVTSDNYCGNIKHSCNPNIQLDNAFDLTTCMNNSSSKNNNNSNYHSEVVNNMMHSMLLENNCSKRNIQLMALRDFSTEDNGNHHGSNSRMSSNYSEPLLVSYVDGIVEMPHNNSKEWYRQSLLSRWRKLRDRFPGIAAGVCYCERCVYEQCLLYSDVQSEVHDNIPMIVKRLHDAINNNNNNIKAINTYTNSILNNNNSNSNSNWQLLLSCVSKLNLGHKYMQLQNYYDAKCLYYSTIVEIISTITDNIAYNSNDYLVTLCDAFHALGGAYLESNYWEIAYNIWDYGSTIITKLEKYFREHCNEKTAPSVIKDVTKSLLFEEVVKRNSYFISKVTFTTNNSNNNATNNITENTLRPLCLLKNHNNRPLYCSSDLVLIHNSKIDTAFSITNWTPNYKYSSVSMIENTAIQPTQLPQCFAVTSKNDNSNTVYITNNSKHPMFSKEECKFVIDAAEEHAAAIAKNSSYRINILNSKNSDTSDDGAAGWTTSRHYAVPTTDLPVHSILSTSTSIATNNCNNAVVAERQPLLLQWFNRVFSEKLSPLLAMQYMNYGSQDGSVSAKVAIHDAFVVKYSMGSSNSNSQGRSQSLLPLHFDQSSHSFTIPLNAADEYEGGGTYFPDLNAILKPDIGELLSFPGGNMLHGGEPISSGTRYILAGFAFITSTTTAATTTTTNNNNNCSTTSNNNNNKLEQSNQSILHKRVSSETLPDSSSSNNNRIKKLHSTNNDSTFSFGFNF